MTTPPALPWGARLWRPLRIWRVVIQLLVGLWWDSRRWSYPEGWSAERLAVRRRRQARWLTAEFLGLGSAFIKLGQILSARPDVFPAEVVEELSHLQDRVPAFPFPVVERILADELGERRLEITDLE